MMVMPMTMVVMDADANADRSDVCADDGGAGCAGVRERERKRQGD
jgi:hypothetical protein